MCIHENDFEPGYGILDNMQVAIENSNSAILVMSQGFVDSDVVSTGVPVLPHWTHEGSSL